MAKLENGKRQNLTLTEWLALAVVLNVAPVHLLVPPYPSPGWGREPGEVNNPSDEALYQLTPQKQVPASRVREFVRGQSPLPNSDPRAFYAETPPQEFEQLVSSEDAQTRLWYTRMLDMTGFNPDGTWKERGDHGPGLD